MHPAVESLLQFFVYEHLPEGLIRDASKPFCALAEQIANKWPDHAETTVAMRKLLEAKDCAVRAIVASMAVK